MKRAEPAAVDPRPPFMKMRAHQREAFERFKDEEIMALFFEMGCGKSFTLLSIAEYKWREGQIEGLLVIAPNDVHRQWYDELVNGAGEEHEMELSCPFEAQCFGGRGGQDELYEFEPGRFWFLSVNVDTFSTPRKWEPVVEWANAHRIMIAIDEATSIKNPKSKRSQRLLYEFNDVVKRRGSVVSSKKKFPYRAALTGTPVTNGPCDLWSIMEFLEPNYFRMNWWVFRDYFAMYTQLQVRGTGGGYSERSVDVLLNERTWRGIKSCHLYDEARRRFGCSEDTYLTVMRQREFQGPYKHADELRKMLEPASAFRLLVDCADMPPATYVTRQVSMSDEQKRLYNQAAKEMAAEYGGAVTEAQNMLVLMLRLQQISSGFMVNTGEQSVWDDDSDLLPGDVVWIGKTNPKLDALMKDIAECAKPVIIMTRYTAEAERIYGLCSAEYRTGLFTGWKVVGGVDALKAGEIDVLVANSQKICRGFNLQRAHVTLFYSNSFSMEVRQQAEFRTYRMGQESPCLYVDYAASPVDKSIMQSLKMKKGLLDYIRGEDRDALLSSLKEA